MSACSGALANVPAAEAWVKLKLQGHDASHDWWHIYRVRQMALRLADEESLGPAEREVVELAALLHDVGDYKYSKDSEADFLQIRAFLEGLQLSAAQRECILFIIQHMGFKEELQQQGAAGAEGRGACPCPLAFAVVQDADRLDAIGAIGIARCLTFGGHFNRVLHDPAIPPRLGMTKQQYMDKAVEQTTLNHFYEKLLLLKGLMKTAAGRRVAEQRHEYMQGFLDQLLREWEGAA